MNRSGFLLYSIVLSSFVTHAFGEQVPVDNSAVNERDRSAQAQTPDDQSQSKSNVEFAARIRRTVLAQPGLSVSGQNIKIIAQPDRIILRGPVKDVAERTTIENAVRRSAGTATIDDQLEVK